MSKPNFENENEMINFLKDISNGYEKKEISNYHSHITFTISAPLCSIIAEKEGYIKQSDLEIAKKDYYNRFKEMESGHMGMENIKFEKSKIHHKYIIELEKENKKLKEGK